MNSLAINTPIRTSNYSMPRIALALATLLFAVEMSSAQQLQQGVNVQLAVTSNASPMRDADNRDAWIVTVAADGSLYFGIGPVNPTTLADEMKSRPRRREQKLYIKADARAPFADVERVLEAARGAFFEAPVLLTSQPAAAISGTIVPPQGLEVLPAPPPSSAAQSTIVQVTGSGQQAPTLRVNNQQIPWANLQNLLAQLFQNRTEKIVLVKADGALSFADIAHVIDTCRSTGAKVVLATPTL